MHRKYFHIAFGITVAAGLVAAAETATAREVVRFADTVAAGTVIVRTAERRLYYVLGGGQALRYTVGVGKRGRQWTGSTRIDGKYLRPAWSPPPDIRRDNPRLPDVIAGGAPNNPMGVAALTLAGGDYAIHGTNRPESIGGYVSYGCIRMHNHDILDLYDRVQAGTAVLVTR